MVGQIKKLIDNKTMVVIAGPTASGKTGVAVELSKLINIEVISSDSRQIYKFLDIGTAKPTKEETDAVKHHFIDFVDPADYYSAGVFGKEADKCAHGLLKQNILPVVAGGTGLYIKALCEGFFDEDSKIDPEIKDKIQSRLESEGREVLYDELKNIDPVSAEIYTDMNPRRITRALEYYYANKVPLSQAQQEKKEEKNFNVLYFALDVARDKLYEKINYRAEWMWKNGLIQETEKVLDMGYSPELNSLNTVGYKECIAYLKKEISAERALELMQQNTRRYAKRQMTWFRKIPGITWLSGPNEEIAGQIYNHLMSMNTD